MESLEDLKAAVGASMTSISPAINGQNHAAAPTAVASQLGVGPSSATSGTSSRQVSLSSGSASSGREMLQIIDEDQTFTDQLPEFMKRCGLYDKGFSYDVVAVFGSQSTGKSTLLNRVFGTSFAVMSEHERRQTTKGIWMSKGESMPVLIMDVEGTDGRERGEDQDFERKSALFSMASAEVILVNLWEHQVGLYQGANMGLLKTVMEVNLGLFQASKSKQTSKGQDKTLLLFVIRDHIEPGGTPLANLSRTLTADLERLWSGLSKPEGLEQSRISDYFDLDFVTLPHKLLKPEQFDVECSQLRTRFVDRHDPNYVFKPIYHKRIPADGLSIYFSQIWSQVLSNKDLDLPSQQELLAQYRCDEIASLAFADFETDIKLHRKPVEGGKLVEALGKLMAAGRATCIAKFDRDASRYHPAVYQRKRAELLAKANASLSPLYVGQLKNVHKQVVRDFKAAILAQLKADSYDFASVVDQTRQKAESTFITEAKALSLDGTDWSYDDALVQLREDITAIADTCRVEETKRMVTSIERALKKAYNEPVEIALKKPTTEMWDNVLKAYKTAIAKAETAYLAKAGSFNCTEEENTAALSSLRRKAWLSLRQKIDEQVSESALLVKLKLAFEDRFRYDAEGIPRVWKPEDNMDDLFRSARESTLALIPLYANIRPSDPANQYVLSAEDAASTSDDVEPFDFDESLVVLSETKSDELANRFRREADAYYVEAKRSLVSSISQIPVWMYCVLVALGWNEFIAVIRSPIYFTLLLLGATAAYITIQLNMVGPVMTIGRSVINETYRVGHEKLREHFNTPEIRRMYEGSVAVPAEPMELQSRAQNTTDDQKER
ncbi:uncharacterized protein L969DRAFT_89889 [Mixia osmundae IAM 14324]|uniref:GB1/RHD3-type G domain-containing protein n=1 Tax=Mixia osmundae (strain CBS 9802 / IAM 14324 / JCM 22182 / KY 12970) TaxID=764103 RepID=G7DWG9_MIXOS|nr:uncharacterized protein L969DRAFT_89889 [Mixia osmundae IAM 14324]KEI37331.1 hypothetical protein L969DRAFT_89889 [Mixia osmundae IAM 14324]GAA94929.1 hypothetical protein E5Q_01584 [Mixia osmundae IAM 14324]